MTDYQEALGIQEDQDHLLVPVLQVCLSHPVEANQTKKGQLL